MLGTFLYYHHVKHSLETHSDNVKALWWRPFNHRIERICTAFPYFFSFSPWILFLIFEAFSWYRTVLSCLTLAIVVNLFKLMADIFFNTFSDLQVDIWQGGGQGWCKGIDLNRTNISHSSPHAVDYRPFKTRRICYLQGWMTSLCHKPNERQVPCCASCRVVTSGLQFLLLAVEGDFLFLTSLVCCYWEAVQACMGECCLVQLAAAKILHWFRICSRVTCTHPHAVTRTQRNTDTRGSFWWCHVFVGVDDDGEFDGGGDVVL